MHSICFSRWTLQSVISLGKLNGFCGIGSIISSGAGDGGGGGGGSSSSSSSSGGGGSSSSVVVVVVVVVATAAAAVVVGYVPCAGRQLKRSVCESLFGSA